MIEFLLASASPRRKEILQNLGIGFRTIPAPEIDEEIYLNNSLISPEDTALQLAEKKSLALKLTDFELALTADTVVAIDNLTLGKPKTDNEA
ncbi:MAG: Maf family protein, partial [bacterium]